MKPSTIVPAQALALALANEIPETRIARVLSDAMAADVVNRDGSRSPDHRLRITACEIALARLYGLPIRREESIVMNLDAEQSENLEDRLSRSPSLRKSLAATLAKIEGEDKPPAIEA